MRLTTSEANSIKNCINAIDQQAEVYLFGSRTDDQKKGGDIDLFIISDKIDFNEKLLLKICIKEKIGDQKIDLVTSHGKHDLFAKVALENAIKLL